MVHPGAFFGILLRIAILVLLHALAWILLQSVFPTFFRAHDLTSFDTRPVSAFIDTVKEKLGGLDLWLPIPAPPKGSMDRYDSRTMPGKAEEKAARIAVTWRERRWDDGEGRGGVCVAQGFDMDGRMLWERPVAPDTCLK